MNNSPDLIENKNDQKDEISLREIILDLKLWLNYLLSKWLLIASMSIAGGIAGLIYSSQLKPVYRAYLTFVLEDDKNTSMGAAAGLASQFGLDVGGASSSGAFSGENLIELLKSRSMVQKTLLSPIDMSGKTITIAEYFISINNLRKGFKEPGLKDIHFPLRSYNDKLNLLQDSLLSEFYQTITKSNLKVDKADKKSSIIAVEVTSLNELFSKLFTEKLVKNVSDFYIETKTKKEAENISILQYQADSVRRQLNAAISGVASFQDVNPNPNPALQILRIPSQRRQFDVQTNTAILTELIRNLELSKLALRRETPLIQVIDTPILPLEKVKLGKTKASLLGGIGLGCLVLLCLTLRMIYLKLMESDAH